MERTQEELNELLKEAIQRVESQGFKPAPINPFVGLRNSATELGRCTKEKIGFSISISKFFANGEKEKLMDTLVHEVLHTLEGCFNHGPQWNKAAVKMNEAFGHNISRVSTFCMSKLSEEHQAILKKYTIKCLECGQEIHRQRLSKVIKYPELYSCGCGGDFERIK